MRTQALFTGVGFGLSWNIKVHLKLKIPTHHYLLYSRVGWPALSSRRVKHWYLFIYKVVLSLLPSYLQQKGIKNYGLRSQDYYLLSIPKVHSKTMTCAKIMISYQLRICY